MGWTEPMTAVDQPRPSGAPEPLRVDGPEAEAALLTQRLTPTLWVVVAAALLWTAVVLASLLWSVVNETVQTRELATREARAHFNKDHAFRLWATRHGGVYVPASKETPPNPYLSHVPERDLVTPSGKALTLMNPAYMVRQMSEEYDRLFGVKGHITSLKLHNPDNAPDDWERAALQAFETGTTEVFEVSEIDGKPYLRLMRPMLVQEGCLKCHAYQGYKVGDIRGGVGVAVPLEQYRELERQSIIALSVSHGAFWLLGLTGIAEAGRRIRRRLRQQVRDEMEIRSLSHRNQLLLDSVGEGICGLDRDGRVTFVNQAALRILRGSTEQLAGRLFHQVIHHHHEDGTVYSEYDCAMAQSFRDGFAHEARDEVFWRLDGTSFPVDVLSTPIIEDGDRCGAVVVFRDVTHQRAAENGLHEKTEALERSNADLEQFAYVASHDLREPLRMITSYLQLLKRRYGGMFDKDAEDFIGFAVDGAQRMDRLILDLLAYSRVDRKGAPFEAVPAERAVSAVLQVLRGQLEESDAKVEVEPLPTVWADELQLISLFQNLLNNALKYRDHERPPKIRISARRIDGSWEFTVADNGIGIDAQYFERIFQIFQRLHPSQQYEGSGIGLALCKRIVERHRGRIWVDSAPGQGSTFHFTLPAG